MSGACSLGTGERFEGDGNEEGRGRGGRHKEEGKGDHGSGQEARGD